MTSGRDLCLDVDALVVGDAASIGRHGAGLHLEPCKAFAPEQTFSAPHVRPPAT